MEGTGNLDVGFKQRTKRMREKKKKARC